MCRDGTEQFVEIEHLGGVVATDNAHCQVILLEFRQKGVAVLLTYAEVLAIGRALRSLAKVPNLVTGGTNGY